jgi:hypothetical protein
MLACLVGRHRPSLQSITRRQGGLTALCENCARPLQKESGGRWTVPAALYAAGQATTCALTD